MFVSTYLFIFSIIFLSCMFFDVSTITRQKHKRDKDNTAVIFYFFVSM